VAPEKGPARALRAARVLVTRGALNDTRALLEELDALPEDELATEQRQELLKMRARLAVAEGAGDEHVAVLEEVVALDPLDGEAIILLAQHEERTDNAEKAMFLYDRAAAIEAFEAEAKTLKAQILVRQKRYDEALPLLRRAQALAPRDSVQDFIEDIERVSRTR
jgi:tetratricopeptide (TPR) repeat protein